jgi:hypothetical protein
LPQHQPTTMVKLVIVTQEKLVAKGQCPTITTVNQMYYCSQLVI